MYNAHSNSLPNDVFTYSQIINPVDYNKIMSEQHLYISASDKFLTDVVKRAAAGSLAEVVELGCGPGRILPLLREALPEANIRAIEVDEKFAEYAKETFSALNINIIIEDVEFFSLPNPVDAFYSQGFHHHVSKARKTRVYLQNVYDHLKKGGIYVLSDEFLPNYSNEAEREEKAIIWYSHIIAHAILHGHDYLAREEAKTLLDDIYEGRGSPEVKSNAQIEFVLSQVSSIDTYARNREIEKLKKALAYFQNDLEKFHNLKSVGDVTIDLSRHDYKICERVLRAEVEKVGFNIEEIRSFGPIKDIGAMSVYILKK